MPVYRITPLAPAYVLMVGAALILAVGPALAPRRRHGLAVALGTLAALSLFFVGSGYAAEVQLVRVLVEWLGTPALALRVSSFEPFLWVLILSHLAVSLAELDEAGQLAPRHVATRFLLTAAACGVVLAGNYRTLAYGLLLFDGATALFALVVDRPGRAVGRLLLGVLSSGLVMALARGSDYLTANPSSLGPLFSLTIWLRLGLFPLVESEAQPENTPLTMRLEWIVANLTVGLYLASAGVAPWLVWLAGATTLLHGALAWLETDQARALAHTGQTLAGGALAMAAAAGNGPGVVAASLSTLAGLAALCLALPHLKHANSNRLNKIWAYLPPLLASLSLAGLPFTLGWDGRGALYRATWEAGVPGLVALIVVAEGAALAVVYRYWQHLLSNAPADVDGQAPGGEAKRYAGERIGHRLGATLASIPFLFPVLVPRLFLIASSSAASGVDLGPPLVSTSLGIGGSLLWATFLGYGRLRLLGALPASHLDLMSTLRLEWLLRGLGQALDTLGRVLLRLRAVVEGEHYLAWAILLALGLGLLVLSRG